MPRPKKTTKEEAIEESVVETKVNQPESELLKVIEAYKLQNPKKYDLKKAELEVKLNK